MFMRGGHCINMKSLFLVLSASIAFAQQPSLPIADLQAAGVPSVTVVGTCQNGQRYFQTDAVAGFNNWFCALGIWVQQPPPTIVPPVPGSSDNFLIFGGGVTWITGYTFRVSVAVYNIQGLVYTTVEQNITLGAAGGVNPRFDVIGVDNTGSVIVIPGVEDPNPVLPDVDPSSQLLLTYIFVPALSVAPPNVIQVDLYHENAGWPAEYNCAVSGGTFNCSSAVNPHAGVRDIEATAAASGQYARLTRGAGTMYPDTMTNLIFYIRSKATWPTSRQLNINFRNGAASTGVIVTFRQGSFGFNSSLTTAYQQIVIPISMFQNGQTPVNRLQFTVAGSGATIGFYIDDVILQSGINVVPPSNAAVWRGPWNATAAYSRNDMVSYLGVSWVAVAGSTNSAPSDTNPLWQKMVAGSNVGAIDFTFDGGGADITTGLKAWIPVTYAGAITGWELTANAVCAMTIDTYSSNYAGAPPVGGSIWGAKPALAGAQRNTAVGLNIAIVAGTYYRANVDANVGCGSAVLHILTTRN